MKQRQCKPWHYHERRMVREHYKKMPTTELAARLGRTVGSVKKEAARLGLAGENHAAYRWTPERKRRFLDAYKTNPEDAARRFGLTRMSANSYASRFFRHPIRRPYETWEDNLIRELWPQHKDEALNQQLNRTPQAIRNRAYKLGLRRPAVHEWTKWRFSDKQRSTA